MVHHKLSMVMQNRIWFLSGIAMCIDFCSCYSHLSTGTRDWFSQPIPSPVALGSQNSPECDLLPSHYNVQPVQHFPAGEPDWKHLPDKVSDFIKLSV